VRFLRFLKMREDKRIEEAGIPDFLTGLWKKQEAEARLDGKAGAGKEGDEEGDGNG
jgi:hypothetical protein